jgi:hypothetical protein
VTVDRGGDVAAESVGRKALALALVVMETIRVAEPVAAEVVLEGVEGFVGLERINIFLQEKKSLLNFTTSSQ